MKKEVYAYLHTHWDREWYRPFEEFRLRLIEVVDEVISQLEKNEIPFFYFDAQTIFLEDYLEICPQNNERIKKLIKEKKLFIGPFYCSTDSFLVNAMSYLKNIDLGLKISNEYNNTDFLAYLSDTFGHSSCLPEIFSFKGIKNAFLWRGLGNIKTNFIWDKINATYLKQGYFHDYLSLEIPIEQKASLILKQLEKIDEDDLDILLLPLGADHLTLAKNVYSQITEINKYLENYEIKLKTPFEYIEKISNSKKPIYYGEFRDNSRNFILQGVYSSRIDLKQQNALCQWDLFRKTEPLMLIKKNENYINELLYAEKLLIKNHPHDSIYGCSVDEVHAENLVNYNKVQQITNGVQKRFLRDISQNTDKITVINLSNYEYSGPVRITTDKKLNSAQLISKNKGFTNEKLYNPNEIPITEDYKEINEYLIDVKNLPPFSITSLDENNINSAGLLKSGEHYLENEFIAVKIQNNKLTLINKLDNEILEDFFKIIDKADIGDSYNYSPLKGEKPIQADLIYYKLKEKGDVCSILELAYEIEIPEISDEKIRSKNLLKHILNVELILYSQSKFLEFKIDWENISENHLLQAVFELSKPISETYSDDMLSVVKRQISSDYKIEELIPQNKGIELKNNTFPMQRFVNAQNFGVITKGLNEYEIFQNELKITLLRATGVISNPQNPTRTTPAGPPLKTPDLQMKKELQVNFAICFINEPAELHKITENFYYPLFTTFSDEKNIEFLNISPDNFQLLGVNFVGKDEIELILYNNNPIEKKSIIKFHEFQKELLLGSFELGSVKFRF